MGTFLGDFVGYKANYGYTNKNSTAAKNGSMGSTISALNGTARVGKRFAKASAGALKSAISAATNAVAECASGSRRGGGGGSAS